jgi:hypothetical protein
MTAPKKADDPSADEPQLQGDPQLHGDPEPPPAGHDEFTSMFTEPQPFDSPPDEDVQVVGDIPWELRDDDEYRS